MWIKDLLLDIFFPKFCLICKKEGDFLCEDCQALFQISGFHQKYSTQNLKDLYFPAVYQNGFLRRLIKQFKYEPLVKELASSLSSLIIAHFQLMDNKPDFSDFILIPVPQTRKREKSRGFNPALELGKELSGFFRISLINGCLAKIKETPPQAELSNEKRKENVKGSFSCRSPNLIKGRRIILIDDVYTTGSTMEECARVLKMAGAKEIVGVVVARG